MTANWQIPIGDALRRTSLDHGDREALVIGSRRLTWRDLCDGAERLAQRFRGIGVGPDTRVALAANNSVEWVLCYYSILLAGGTLVPANPRYAPPELRYVLRKARCDLLLAQSHIVQTLDNDRDEGESLARPHLGILEFDGSPSIFADLADDARAPALRSPEPDSTATILFTSGSTAFPKGCMLAHDGMLRNAFLHDARLHISAEDRWFGPTPFFHVGGCIWGILSCVVSGATLVATERFDAENSLEILERERCTHFHGIETIFVRQLEILKRRRFDLRSVIKGTTSGSLSLIERIRDEMGIQFIMSKYGLTEGYGALALCDLDDPPNRLSETHGRIFEEFEYRIASIGDPAMAMPTGHEGEIQVRGGIMQGYFNDPEATERAILPGGWLRTGDIGRLDGKYLLYTGRLKDMIKVGGENVAAAEVEAALQRHPAVLNAAVVGRADAEWGEKIVAYVELVAGAEVDENAIMQHCRRQLSGIKTPRQIIFMKEMPRTGSEKIDKKQLK